AARSVTSSLTGSNCHVPDSPIANAATKHDRCEVARLIEGGGSPYATGRRSMAVPPHNIGHIARRRGIMAKYKGKYRFSFGPWNIDEGADPFGPTVRKPEPFAKKLKTAVSLKFDGIQFHDDDVVPDIDTKSHDQKMREARKIRKMLEGEGLVPEFVAPRLWFAPETIDGAYTNNTAKHRRYAI